MPDNFHGLPSEDAEAWLRDIQHFCAFRKLDDQGSLGVIPLLMKDGARHWFESLDGAARDTLAHFNTAFRDHFKRDAANSWKDTAAVWTTSQQAGQSVEAYISQVEQKGIRAKMEEEQLRFSIINGLRTHIRQQVLQHEPKSIAEIRKWANIAESSYDAAEILNPDTTTRLARLEDKLDRMQVKPISSPRSQSPIPRVHFNDRGGDDRYRTREANQAGGPNEYNQGRANNRPTENTRGDQRNNYQKGGREDRQQPNYQAWSVGGRQQPNHQTWGRGNGQQPSTQYTPDDQTCYNCGGRRHPMRLCPARTVTCSFCGRVGHWARLCMQARRTQQ